MWTVGPGGCEDGLAFKDEVGLCLWKFYPCEGKWWKLWTTAFSPLCRGCRLKVCMVFGINVKSCPCLKTRSFYKKSGPPAFLETLGNLACWRLFSGRATRGWRWPPRTSSALCLHLVTFPKTWTPELIEFATPDIKRGVARFHVSYFPGKANTGLILMERKSQSLVC